MYVACAETNIRVYLLYRVIQNLGPPSRDETGKVLAKPTITPCNITKSKWGAQKSRSETSLPGQNDRLRECGFIWNIEGFSPFYLTYPYISLH